MQVMPRKMENAWMLRIDEGVQRLVELLVGLVENGDRLVFAQQGVGAAENDGTQGCIFNFHD